MLKASWNDELIEELRSFPNGVHDDQSDAGADAYNELFGGGTGADSLFDYMKELHEAARSCAGNKQ
jgi:phage terminase large subunit-like protein